MYISHIKLRNWRNFRQVDVDLLSVSYILGANATGKSNFLDAFRFLRDIAKPQGGGLQQAISDRDGVSKVRCLHSRGGPIGIEVRFKRDLDKDQHAWEYHLEIQGEKGGLNRPIIVREEVRKFSDAEPQTLLARPNEADEKDKELLTQTSLEQIQSNGDFREIADFFSNIAYLHLIPQLLKYGGKIGGNPSGNDPFGQEFLARVAKTPEKTRNSRLKRIQKALETAIPQFDELQFERDAATGRPHLKAKYKHHRPLAGWQREEQFSDGTLRLIALFWMLIETNSLLLLEEPELSLDEAIVGNLSLLIDRLLRKAKNRNGRQLIITTHSHALLQNEGIDGRGVLRLELTKEGSVAHAPNEDERNLLKEGFSVAEILLPKAHPKTPSQMSLDL